MNAGFYRLPGIAGKESRLLQVGLQALTDVVQRVYHQIFIASFNVGWPFETQSPGGYSSS
jgi:hypothetical protein